VLFAIGVELARGISSDIGFLLYAAGRVLGGARLYVDLIEINPPLIVWLNLPVVLAARALALPEILVYRLATVGALLACVGVTARTLRYAAPAGEPRERDRLLFFVTLVLFLIPGADFAQREHLMLALITPYLVLTTARSMARAVAPWPAIGVGALAGVGFALKPHFLLLLAALEGYLLVRRPSVERLVRPEALGAAAVLLAYAVIVLLVTPEYLPMVRLLGGSYLGFLYDPFLHLLATAPGVILCYFALLAWVALRKHLGLPAFGEVLVVSILGALAAGAAQQKGLPYHFYPSSALALVLLGIVVADSWGAASNAAERLYQVLAGGVLATAAIGAVADGGLQLARRESSPEPEMAQLAKIIRQKAPSQPIFIMSYHIGSAFPLVNYSGAVLGSRFHHLWILASDYLQRMKSPEPLRYRVPAEMPASERFLNQAVLADLERYQPRLLIVLRHGRDDPGNGYRRFDYIRYFSRDPRLARILGQYQELETVGDYAVYQRVSGSVARTRPPPAVTPGTQDLQRRRADVLGLRIWSPTFLIRLGVFLSTIAALTAIQLAGRSRARGAGSPDPGGM
jgi:hypothetical protein